MLITFIGGELFTGNCLTSMGAMDHRFSWGKVVRDLCIIWLSNLVGALIIVALTYFSGNLDYSAGLLGAYSIKVALGKATITPIKGIASGILCNILVCAAILMGAAAKDISGKVWAIFFPIMAFVVGGFEHCVANMFYIPMGMIAATNDVYVAKAVEAYGITADQLASLSVAGFFTNQIPVTIGNILGGMIFVGLPCYLAHCKKKQA
jgi:formate/nitrite transporter